MAGANIGGVEAKKEFTLDEFRTVILTISYDGASRTSSR